MRLNGRVEGKRPPRRAAICPVFHEINHLGMDLDAIENI
jgi:hypothetical protein